MIHQTFQVSVFQFDHLTHCSRETPERVIGKQYRPRSDPAGSSLFAKSSTNFL